ncbi:Gfo/Idh/MocA family protein [Nucisporomicrobium flavum]|uniref:Gfo/Idh/MocA family protein n=1 Tax=Nucisporomicrobium flavum TaxID=2785915 RepID=UPI0018F349AE|nr:Gfo/Idh/MocA family oxidoreductase [Nucisporomicrobium flavum]
MALPVVLAGAGAMGRAWLAAIAADPAVELTGVADLDLGTARRAAPGLPVGTDVVALAAQTGARAVIDVTVPEAHHPVTTAALLAGLPVLGEKPAADTLARALSLCAASEVSGQLFMVSQSRRWNPRLFRLRAMTARLGGVASAGTDFFRAPHFGGFREQMAQPLLTDMAVHAFDAARFVLAAEPVEVSCRTWNPSWSWYAGDACAAAVFEMTGGARYVYHGSWCTPGSETSWNGMWRINGEHGTATWDGENEPAGPAADEPAGPAVDGPVPPYEGIAGALRVFADALATGTTPMGEIHENVPSLAMVEAAIHSSDRGRPVTIGEVLDDAYAQAVTGEQHPDVRAALRGWPSARDRLGLG